MDYSKYLPHVDVNDGKARIMNNMKLYTKLLSKFKGRQMTDDLIAAMEAKDMDKVGQLAHAMRGTASNLSFPTVQKIASDIEMLAKGREDAMHLAGELDVAVTKLDECIAEIVAG